MRDDERENIFTVGTGRQKTVSGSRRDRRMAAEESGRSRGRDRGRKTAGKRKRGCGGALLSFLCGVLVIVSAFFAGMGAGWYRWGRDAGPRVDLSSIEMPDWIEQNLIRKNIYSRPAVSLREVNDIVVHYVANPGSTAEQNRNYLTIWRTRGRREAQAPAPISSSDWKGRSFSAFPSMKLLTHPITGITIPFPLNAAIQMKQENLRTPLMRPW